MFEIDEEIINSITLAKTAEELTRKFITNRNDYFKNFNVIVSYALENSSNTLKCDWMEQLPNRTIGLDKLFVSEDNGYIVDFCRLTKNIYIYSFSLMLSNRDRWDNFHFKKILIPKNVVEMYHATLTGKLWTVKHCDMNFPFYEEIFNTAKRLIPIHVEKQFNKLDELQATFSLLENI